MYRCMVMSWSSGAKLTRRFWYFMLLRRLAAFSLEGGAMAASTVRSRFKTCDFRIVTYAVIAPLEGVEIERILFAIDAMTPCSAPGDGCWTKCCDCC